MGLLKKWISRGKKAVKKRTAVRGVTRTKTGTVNKLRNQVMKLKLKKQKIKAQRELFREQMRV